MKPKMNPFVSVLLRQVEKMDRDDAGDLALALCDWWLLHNGQMELVTRTEEELVEVIHRTLRSTR